MKFAFGVEYNGSSFCGWQTQHNLVSVQGSLETALSKIANEEIKIFCAGRTDAGVHATGQVAHFVTQANRPLHAWIAGTNSYLPSAISIRWCKEVDESFHARFSALARRYRYIIHNASARSALYASAVTWFRCPLDITKMQFAANYLLGEQDFSSFRSSQCESKSPMRHIEEITLFRKDNFVILEIQANAFLHHMVRNIVGVLLEIGAGWKEPDWILEVLNAKNRQAAAETASPHGLYLNKVIYPEKYLFPSTPNMFLLL